MKRFVLTIAAVLALVASVSAVKTVNGRAVPDSTDRTTYGNSTYFRVIDTLLSETVNMMGATKNGDDLAVDDINCDTIAATGNVQVTGAVFVDSLKYNGQVSISPGRLDVDTLNNPVVVITPGMLKVDTIGSAELIVSPGLIKCDTISGAEIIVDPGMLKVDTLGFIGQVTVAPGRLFVDTLNAPVVIVSPGMLKADTMGISTYFNDDAWVADTLRAKKVIFGAGNAIAVDSLINEVATGADTIVIVINGKKLRIAVTREE